MEEVEGERVEAGSWFIQKALVLVGYRNWWDIGFRVESALGVGMTEHRMVFGSSNWLVLEG